MRPKDKGTKAETTVKHYARLRTGDEGIDRLALHGRNDVGDVGYLHANGFRGIVEVKHYKDDATELQVHDWFGQAETERANARVDFVLLVYHRNGKSMEMRGGKVPPTFKDNWCAMSVRTLHMLMGIRAMTYEPESLDAMVRMTVEEAFDLFCD